MTTKHIGRTASEAKISDIGGTNTNEEWIRSNINRVESKIKNVKHGYDYGDLDYLEKDLEFYRSKLRLVTDLNSGKMIDVCKNQDDNPDFSYLSEKETLDNIPPGYRERFRENIGFRTRVYEVVDILSKSSYPMISTQIAESLLRLPQYAMHHKGNIEVLPTIKVALYYFVGIKKSNLLS